MIKVVGLLTRRAGISAEEFSAYWFSTHADLSARMAPFEARAARYVQSHALKLPRGEAPYDAVAELYFYDQAHMQRWIDWYNSDDGKALRDDEHRFMDVSKRVVIVTDERVLRDDMPEYYERGPRSAAPAGT